MKVIVPKCGVISYKPSSLQCPALMDDVPAMLFMASRVDSGKISLVPSQTYTAARSQSGDLSQLTGYCAVLYVTGNELVYMGHIQYWHLTFECNLTTMGWLCCRH